MSIEPAKPLEEKTIECVIGAVTTEGNANISCSIESPSNKFGSITSDQLATITPIATVVLALATTLYTIWRYHSDSKMQQKQIQSEKDKNHKSEQLQKIEKFYGPFNALREESFILYKHFALEEKARQKDEGESFRTLRYLTQKNESGLVGIEKLEPHDQSILKNIIEISDKSLELIESHGGYIDNSALHTLLGKLAAHFRIIKLAADGKLEGLSEKLEDIVFPREIDGAIDNEINKIEASINPDKVHKKYKPNKTIKFYDENSQQYALRTRKADMSAIYEVFTSFIPKGAKILDAGCGVGRDTKYFIQNGYKVTSFDASKEMVDMCNEYPFALCEVMKFSEIQLGPTFDAVWASASLLHLDSHEIGIALKRLWQSLKPEGYLYFSLKQKVTQPDTRQYYVHEDTLLRRILVEDLEMELIKTWETPSSVNEEDHFNNYIYKKI